MWSIYHKEQTEIEGSEAWEMLQRFPNAGDHGSDNLIFVGTPNSPVNPILLSDLLDLEGTPISGDALAWTVAQFMGAEDRSLGIFGTKAQLSGLHKHPAWRVWCGNYENRPDFEADWNYVAAMVARTKPEFSDLWPAYSEEITYTNARVVMLAAIRLASST